MSQSFGRARGGQLIVLTASCPAGQVVSGGGVEPTIVGGVVTDLTRIHLVTSAPQDAQTWVGMSDVTATLSQTADLHYEVAVLCVPGH